MERIYRHTPRIQATRQFHGKECRGKFRLSIKRVRIIEPFTAEIVVHYVFYTTPCDLRIVVVPNHDPSCAASDQLGETIDKHKLRDVICETSQFGTINYYSIQGTELAH